MNPLPPESYVSPAEYKPSILHTHHVPHWLAYSALIILTAIVGFLSYAYLRAGPFAARPALSSDTPAVLMPVVVPITPGPNTVGADYFSRVRAGYIAERKTFIDADLSAMMLRVYVEGVPALEVPIKTKGREGSWWETPAGVYSVQAKEKNHFSSIGHVYQPWSMVFQGNFFIHGWPYYPDGTEVSSAYSGGCIRLETDDAKKVYDLVSVGTPVIVSESDFAPDSFVYPLRVPTEVEGMTAKRYLVADLKNNVILAEKDILEVAPVASVTKLMTALVGAEYIDLDKTTIITPEMLVETSKPRLTEGQEITVYNLLFPLLSESSNEAAEAVARTLGRKYFISLMNRKAAAINMPDTVLVDPSGSDEGNVSSATDLFSLLKYVYTNRSFVLNISSGKLKDSAYGQSYYTDLSNFNLIPDVQAGFVGGKIGKTTAAGETYAGIFTETIQGEQRPLAVIVLGSEDIYADVSTLLGYVEETYH